MMTRSFQTVTVCQYDSVNQIPELCSSSWCFLPWRTLHTWVCHAVLFTRVTCQNLLTCPATLFVAGPLISPGPNFLLCKWGKWSITCSNPLFHLYNIQYIKTRTGWRSVPLKKLRFLSSEGKDVPGNHCSLDTLWPFFQHPSTIWSRYSTPSYFLRRNKNTSSQRPAHESIHNSPKLEIPQMPINRWMNKQNVVHPYNGLLFSHKKELLIYATTWMNFIMLNERSQTQEYMLYAAIYIKF